MMVKKTSNSPEQAALVDTAATPNRWLTLKDASDFLGVHYTTLRAWADKGEITVFRTPGGHRRFGLDDLRRFLAERVGQAHAADEGQLVDAAVVRVRQEMQRVATESVQRWNYPLQGEAEQARRQRGRQLFSLAVAYVLKPSQRPRVMQSGRDLGYEYGREAAVSGVGLAETGRAVQFFRSQLVEAVRNEEGAVGAELEDLRVERLIDQFLDEVLYAVLDGYSAQR